jgi:hypothetical protein
MGHYPQDKKHGLCRRQHSSGLGIDGYILKPLEFDKRFGAEEKLRTPLFADAAQMDNWRHMAQNVHTNRYLGIRHCSF